MRTHVVPWRREVVPVTAVIDVLRERGYPQVDEASLVRALEDLLPASTDPTELPAGDARVMAAHAGLEITGTSLAGAVERLAARRPGQRRSSDLEPRVCG